MRPLRSSLPRGLYEVSSRVTGDQLLLAPAPEVNEVILGVLGMALRKHPVQLHAFAFLSNHYHLLVSVPGGIELGDFMHFVNGNIASRINKLRDRSGVLWSGRYDPILISQEPEVEAARLRYVHAHGVKEGLVASADEWPGVSSVRALRDGQALVGVWRKLSSIRPIDVDGPHETSDDCDAGQEVPIQLTPLPTWRDLGEEERKARVQAIASREEEEAAVHFPSPLGAAAVLATDPFTRVRSKRGAAPRVVASTRERRTELIRSLRDLEASWREAALEAASRVMGGRRKTAKLPSYLWRTLRLVQ